MWRINLRTRPAITVTSEHEVTEHVVRDATGIMSSRKGIGAWIFTVFTESSIKILTIAADTPRAILLKLIPPPVTFACEITGIRVDVPDHNNPPCDESVQRMLLPYADILALNIHKSIQTYEWLKGIRCVCIDVPPTPASAALVGRILGTPSMTCIRIITHPWDPNFLSASVSADTHIQVILDSDFTVVGFLNPRQHIHILHYTSDTDYFTQVIEPHTYCDSVHISVACSVGPSSILFPPCTFCKMFKA